MDFCLDYTFDGGLFGRVIIEIQRDPANPDFYRLNAQAFQVDSQGLFAAAPKGYPSRTSQSGPTLSISGITAKACSLVPGWIKVNPESGQVINSTNLPEGAQILEELPNTAQVGDHVYIEPTLWVWGKGALLTVAEGKIEELRTIIVNSLPLSGLGVDRSLL